MSNFATFKLVGLEEMRATLKKLPEETQKRVLSLAVRRAAMPLVDAIKTRVPKRTGALRESIGAIVKTNKRTGDTYAIVGPRRGYYRGGAMIGKGEDGRGADVPANYAHMVEFGHQIVAPKSEGKKSATGGGFVAAKPFMRPALVASQSAIGDALVKGVQTGLAAALKRIVKNPAARG